MTIQITVNQILKIKFVTKVKRLDIKTLFVIKKIKDHSEGRNIKIMMVKKSKNYMR